MMQAVPLSFNSAREARATLTAFRRAYRVALRGACVTGPDYHGAFRINVQFGATGFSPAEMAGAMHDLRPIKPPSFNRAHYEKTGRALWECGILIFFTRPARSWQESARRKGYVNARDEWRKKNLGADEWGDAASRNRAFCMQSIKGQK